MNEDLLNEIIHELRKQNVQLDKIQRKQKESTWYLWLIALILVVSVVLPLVFLGLGIATG